jgi:hypothetical protein
MASRYFRNDGDAEQPTERYGVPPPVSGDVASRERSIAMTKRNKRFIVVTLFSAFLLAIAWDIASEISEKGVMRSAGKVCVLILLPALMMTRAVRNEWMREDQPAPKKDEDTKISA